jgi:hypothetical protein
LEVVQKKNRKIKEELAIKKPAIDKVNLIFIKIFISLFIL